MNESLQSARNIHQIIIVVSTIIGVFALSTKTPLNKYQVALNELDTLQKVMLEVNAFRIRSFKQGMVVGLDDTYKRMLEKKTEYNGGGGVAGLTLANIDAQFSSKWHTADSIMLVNPNRSKLGNIILSDHVEQFDISDLPLELHPANDGWEWTMTYHPRASYKYQFGKKDLYRNDPNVKVFLFPKLKSVWEFVKDKDFDQSRVILQNKADETKDSGTSQIDLSGLKVAGELMYLAGPLILLVLLIYLTTLVEHLIAITRTNTDAVKAIEFPWLGIFEGRLSENISIISLQIYPAAISIIMVYKSFLGEPYTIVWSLIYFAVFAFISLYLRLQIVKFRYFVKQLSTT